MADKIVNPPSAGGEDSGAESRIMEKIRLTSRESFRTSVVFVIVLVILFGLSTGFTRFNPIAALLSQGEFWNFLLADFVPPSMGRLGSLFQAAMQTIYMALAATGLSTVLALLLSFFGTAPITRSVLINSVIRAFASILRNIPPLVWAFILVAAFGIGTMVGVLSLIIATTGYLTRFFIEILDEAAEETMEPLLTAGAAMPAIIAQALLPAAMPGFIAWILYCVELNIRASTILGMVGAGGIGLLLMGYIKQFNYAAAATAILAVAVIIIGVNLLTTYLRKLIMR
ncbi:MAG: ABC transporter permease subunit [Treponema sp.]|jgi:phosphonate transport system permease protein|nr:ABC transporter permease subunit [Treponema sp.]